MEGISFAMFLSSECVMNSTNPMPHLATKKKRVPYFPLNPGCLIGILKMVYQNNPHIINWVGFNPLYIYIYTLNNLGALFSLLRFFFGKLLLLWHCAVGTSLAIQHVVGRTGSLLREGEEILPLFQHRL